MMHLQKNQNSKRQKYKQNKHQICLFQRKLKTKFKQTYLNFNLAVNKNCMNQLIVC